MGANAERYVTYGSYTAYIGENDYTYLEDPTGVTKVLLTATKELLSMTDTHLYCLTMDGRLYDIDLAASTTSVISSAPTQEAIDTVTAKKPYTLENGTLSVTGSTGSPVVWADRLTCSRIVWPWLPARLQRLPRLLRPRLNPQLHLSARLRLRPSLPPSLPPPRPLPAPIFAMAAVVPV